MRDNWQVKKLKEISTKPQYGWTTKADLPSKPKAKLLRTTDITPGYVEWSSVPTCLEEPKDLSKYKLQKNDIVISRAGSVGVSFLLKDNPPADTVFASYLIRFKPNINPKFLKFYLDSPEYWNFITEKSSGIALKNVNASKLSELPVPIPNSNIQDLIVQTLDSLFSKIDAGEEGLKKVEKQLEVYRQAVLKKAFETERDWQEYKWSDVVNKVIGGGTPSKKEGAYWNGSIPWASVKDVKSWSIDRTQDFITQKGLSESATNLIPEGRIVIVTRISLGRGFITKFPTAINQDLKALELNEKLVDINFFKWWYISIEKKIQDMGKGTTVKGIRLEDLRNIKIHIPNKNIQSVIVDYITKQMSHIEYIKTTMTDIKKVSPKLRQSILKKAFNGELI